MCRAMSPGPGDYLELRCACKCVRRCWGGMLVMGLQAADDRAYAVYGGRQLLKSRDYISIVSTSLEATLDEALGGQGILGMRGG